MKKVISIILILSFISLVAGICIAQDNGTIQGKVTESKLGNPMVGVNIFIEGTHLGDVSDSAGDFKIKNLEQGQYKIIASFIGYHKMIQQVKIVPDKVVYLNFKLKMIPIIFEEIVVSAEKETYHPYSTINARQIEENSPKDVGEFLRTIPGMSAIKKGGVCLDPVFRGFKGDQLNVQIDGGVHVCGGCPNRIESPTSYVQSEDLEKIEVVRGPSSVRYGASLGGLINLVMTKPVQSEKFEIHGKAQTGYESNSNGKRGRLFLLGSERRFDFFLSGGTKDYGNYKDGDSDEVLSSFRINDYSIKFGLKPTHNQRAQISIRQSFQRDALYPALPMDANEDNSSVYALDYTINLHKKLFHALTSKIYISTVEHIMSNKRKPNYSTVKAVTASNTHTIGGRLELTMNVLKGNLYLGGDYYDLYMEGDRTRDIVSGPKAGKHFNDIIWPDANHRNIGIFIQYQRVVSGKFAGSFGLRMDNVVSSAGNPESSFITLYSAELDRSEMNPSVAFNLDYDLSDKLGLNFTLGQSKRSPGIPERYLYLLPVGVDRYDYLGNPDLNPEKNLQPEIGFKTNLEKAYFKITTYYSLLTDYISAKLDSSASSRSPGVLGVKRFFNIPSAVKYGGEFEVGIQPSKNVLVKGGINYTIGENQNSNEPLPEMPPLEAIMSLRYNDTKDRFWGELSCRVVTKQDRISNEFGETETPGFSVFNFVGGVNLAKYLDVKFGVNNMLDRTYYEHLNRLEKIDGLPIMETGRNFYFSLSTGF